MHTIKLASPNNLFIVDFLCIATSFLVSKNPSETKFGPDLGLATDASNDATTPVSSGFKPESSDVARAGLAEERTEEFLKPARVSRLTCVNRRDSPDTDFPRLRKHYWHRHCDRLSMFQ